jgi:hypothetical protein
VSADAVPVMRLSTHTSRLSDLSRRQALLVLVATAAVIVIGLLTATKLVDRTEGVGFDHTDAGLYEAVAARVAHGESYYSAAAEEQRERGYPLRPFVTVREPALAYLTAAVGGAQNARIVLAGLALATAALMTWRLERIAPGRLAWWTSALLIAVTVGALVGRVQAATHEVWAGMLMAISLVVRGKQRWVPSVVFGLLAVVIRELALPYLVVMALLAWRQGRRREAYGWLAAIAVFAVAFAAHALLVYGQVGGSDPQSQGWLRFGGWPFVLDLVRRSSFLAFLPAWMTAVAVPLALLGWASRRSEMAERVVLVVTVYLAAFMVIGRTENVYWGILFVVILIPGLAFGPSAIGQLVTRIRRPVPSSG